MHFPESCGSITPLSDMRHAPLAQLDRASGYGPEGLGFESSMARRRVATVVAAPFFCLSVCHRAWNAYVLVWYNNSVIDLGTLFVEKEKSKGKGGEI